MVRSEGVELALWLCTLLCLGACGLFAFRSHRAGVQAAQQFPPMPTHAPALVNTAAEIAGSPRIEGRIEIKRIGLSVPVLTDCSDAALRLGSCHIQGTAVAGGLGNMGIAGHRDSSFRSLRNIRQGDTVDVFSASGHFLYTVTRMGVVPADDTSVLAIGEEPELTLVTCFPFHYVGSAPDRFVVHARLRSVNGEE